MAFIQHVSRYTVYRHLTLYIYDQCVHYTIDMSIAVYTHNVYMYHYDMPICALYIFSMIYVYIYTHVDDIV